MERRAAHQRRASDGEPARLRRRRLAVRAARGEERAGAHEEHARQPDRLEPLACEGMDVWWRAARPQQPAQARAVWPAQRASSAVHTVVEE